MLNELTTRSVPVRRGTINEKERSIEAILATEAQVPVFDWERWQIIDEILIARGAELPTQVPLLEMHARNSLDSVLGSVRQIVRAASMIVGRLFFVKGDKQVEPHWRKVAGRHLRDVSAGYHVVESVDIAPNTRQVVDGKEYTAGSRTLRISTKWRLKEMSLVPIGADERAKIRQAIRQCHGWTQTHRLPPVRTESVRNTALDVSAIQGGAVRSERERISAILSLSGRDIPGELVKRAIDESWSLPRTFREFSAVMSR